MLKSKELPLHDKPLPVIVERKDLFVKLEQMDVLKVNERCKRKDPLIMMVRDAVLDLNYKLTDFLADTQL